MDTKFIFIMLLHLLSLISIFTIPSVHGFGFDSASSSCSQKISRRGRAQLLKSIPCDLTQQSYCNLPGTSYPWHAVRRFVHENQGLMKRMYGDVHQISVLRNEIQNNDVDIEELQIGERSSQFSGLSASVRGHKMGKYLNNEYQNSRTNDVLIEPHFRPASTTTTPATTTSSTTTTTAPTTTTTYSNPTKYDKPSSLNIKKELIKGTKQHESLDDINMDDDADDDNLMNTNENYAPDNNLESNSVYETGSTQNPFNQNNIKNIKSSNFQQQLNLNKSENIVTIPTTLKVVAGGHHQQIVKTDIESQLLPSNKSKSKLPDQTDLIQKIHENIRNVNESLGKKQFIDQTTSTSQQNPNRTVADTTESTEKLKENGNGGGDKKKYSGNSRPSHIQNNMMEGQLFQDTVHKEIPTTNFRGVNACPVKEEVVAPFWANNTRGEVLALLNLYPFEQYVHWERCTNEHKQMYCRDGCRCEQQYSLHRLLAYDPRDECRGIFSDWFRFPSCCVCKCYNIPLEFRATSRSPRSDSDLDGRRHPIDVAEAEVHRAIYEHATEDWYRPQDQYDFNYDDYLD